MNHIVYQLLLLFVGETGMTIADRTELSESFVGGLFTAVETSLPELIVSISAVTQGSVTMAVSNIVGGIHLK
ncbi:MAG: hypothetical protein ACK40G_13015 [Cytophagaceae bacterium]